MNFETSNTKIIAKILRRDIPICLICFSVDTFITVKSSEFKFFIPDHDVMIENMLVYCFGGLMLILWDFRKAIKIISITRDTLSVQQVRGKIQRMLLNDIQVVIPVLNTLTIKTIDCVTIRIPDSFFVSTVQRQMFLDTITRDRDVLYDAKDYHAESMK